MNTNYKYEAIVLANPNSVDFVKLIGDVKANSIDVLKELARKQARLCNERGRILIQDQNSDREWYVNA